MRIFILAILLSFPAFAADAPPLAQKQVGVMDAKLITQVEGYLSTLKTVSANFMQMSASGAVSGGKFYLERPKKFRWEYDNRSPILIISTGKQLVYYDKQLGEVTYLPMDNSLINFLARDNVKLSGDVKLLSITEDAKEIRAVITQTKKPEEGKLALYFAKTPMRLAKMEVIDADMNITSIAFSNFVVGQSLPKDVFVFKNPKYVKDVWKKK